jgi:hypothetical protein
MGVQTLPEVRDGKQLQLVYRNPIAWQRRPEGLLVLFPSVK